MKTSKIITSLFVLSILASCSMLQGKKLTTVEGSKIIIVNSTIGQFFFTANGREKVDGGYKFDFAIGNKDHAQYEGLSVKVRWGKKPAAKNSQILAKDLKVEDVVIDILKAGEWKNFTVIIPAKSESEMEILNLAIAAVDKISLNSAE